MRPRWMSNVASRETSESSVATTSSLSPRHVRSLLGRLVLPVLLSGLAGCAGQPGHRVASHEYFPESIYGRASPRVVADGQPIPHGGGRYLVGRPYTIAGRTYVPTKKPRATQYGIASYYGSAFRGRRTANGEIYDMASISAANPTMPLPSYARVTDLANHRSIIVRVNDRGPFTGGRVMDVSYRAAQLLDFARRGTARVRIDYLGPAPLATADNAMLLASLRTDGRPAELANHPAAPTMLASTSSVPSVGKPLEELASVDVDVLAATQRTPRAPTRMPLHAPLPPARPFDLGALPSAGLPFTAGRRHRAQAVLDKGSVPLRAGIGGKGVWKTALAR